MKINQETEQSAAKNLHTEQDTNQEQPEERTSREQGRPGMKTKTSRGSGWFSLGEGANKKE